MTNASISVRKVRGKERFVVDFIEGKVRKRRFFSTQGEARSFLGAQAVEAKTAQDGWRALAPEDRDELIAVWDKAVRHGVSLRSALDNYLGLGLANDHAVGKSIDDFLKEKAKAKLTKKTMGALKSHLKKFRVGRETTKLHEVTRDDIAAWLPPADKPYTYNAYLASVRAFFDWAVLAKSLAKSPAKSVRKIGRKQLIGSEREPSILTTDQCARLLTAAKQLDPGLLLYVAVGIFAGLRPEREAKLLSRSDIVDGKITVLGAHSKDRQRRFVDVHPTLDAWIKASPNPTGKNFRRRFARLRSAGGLIKLKDASRKFDYKLVDYCGWDHDVMRHTFASHYMPIHGADKTREQLGHGDFTMLFSHYRRLVSREEAERFWTLTPAVVEKMDCDLVAVPAGVPPPPDTPSAQPILETPAPTLPQLPI